MGIYSWSVGGDLRAKAGRDLLAERGRDLCAYRDLSKLTTEVPPKSAGSELEKIADVCELRIIRTNEKFI